MRFLDEFVFAIKCVFYHTPQELLNADERKHAKQYGLVHFTRSENVESILKNGVTPGNKPVCIGEKVYTWFYLFEVDRLDERLHYLQGKKNKGNLNSYVVIRDLDCEKIASLRINNKLKKEIVFSGTLKTNDMSYVILGKETA